MKDWKGFLSGVVTAVLLFTLAGNASAAVSRVTQELEYRNIRVSLDGDVLDLRNAIGEQVEPFMFGGTNYLPVRALAEALGLHVAWDGSQAMVVLTTPSAIPASESKIAAVLETVDAMDGLDFEYWTAGLLRDCGYSDVTVTQASGDQGVDVTAEKDGIRYAVQCKRYSSSLGNTPVQEVYAGKGMYHAQIGAVITNQSFTAGGRELAESNGVLLWDRDWITDRLAELEKRGKDISNLGGSMSEELPSTVEVTAESGYTPKDAALPESQGVTEDAEPAGGQGAAENQSVSKHDSVYVLNTGTRKFHFPSCTSAHKISAENRSEFAGTREELIAQGYSPCGNCKP